MTSTSAYLAFLGAQVSDGAVSLRVGPDHLNHGGILHGGVVATLLDSVMGHTVGAALAPDHGTATASFTVSFLEPAFLGDELRATAEIVRRGSSLVTVEGSAHRVSDERLIARALGTFAVTRPRRA